MIDRHLLGEILFEPFVAIHIAQYETQGVLKLYLHCRFAYLTVVEPCLREPPDTCLVSIDADKSRYVEALDVYIESSERVDELTIGYCLNLYFFFTSSAVPCKYIPCCKAI